jgi:hypothetical protein
MNASRRGQVLPGRAGNIRMNKYWDKTGWVFAALLLVVLFIVAVPLSKIRKIEYADPQKRADIAQRLETDPALRQELEATAGGRWAANAPPPGGKEKEPSPPRRRSA